MHIIQHIFIVNIFSVIRVDGLLFEVSDFIYSYVYGHFVTNYPFFCNTIIIFLDKYPK